MPLQLNLPGWEFISSPTKHSTIFQFTRRQEEASFCMSVTMVTGVLGGTCLLYQDYFFNSFCFRELGQSRGIYHPERNPTPSSPPVTGWKHFLDDEWKDDEQLTVTQTRGKHKINQWNTSLGLLGIISPISTTF